MTKEGRLTKRQKEILEYIKKYSAQKKYPPSIREISANFNLSSPATAHVHVKKLIEKGYLKRGKTSNHLLELQVPNEFETKSDDVVTVPLLGKVTAGNPIEAIEVPNEVITLPAYLLPKRKEVFTIKVEGDSVIVKRQYEDRYHEVKAKMPCLITALSELNEPRYMTPGGIFDACEAEITTMGRAELKTLEDGNMGLAGSPTKIAKASDKVRKGAGEKITLDTEEAVSYLLGKMTEKHVCGL